MAELDRVGKENDDKRKKIYQGEITLEIFHLNALNSRTHSFHLLTAYILHPHRCIQENVFN